MCSSVHQVCPATVCLHFWCQDLESHVRDWHWSRGDGELAVNIREKRNGHCACRNRCGHRVTALCEDMPRRQTTDIAKEHRGQRGSRWTSQHCVDRRRRTIHNPRCVQCLWVSMHVGNLATKPSVGVWKNWFAASADRLEHKSGTDFGLRRTMQEWARETCDERRGRATWCNTEEGLRAQDHDVFAGCPTRSCGTRFQMEADVAPIPRESSARLHRFKCQIHAKDVVYGSHTDRRMLDHCARRRAENSIDTQTLRRPATGPDETCEQGAWLMWAIPQEVQDLCARAAGSCQAELEQRQPIMRYVQTKVRAQPCATRSSTRWKAFLSIRVLSFVVTSQQFHEVALNVACQPADGERERKRVVHSLSYITCSRSSGTVLTREVLSSVTNHRRKFAMPCCSRSCRHFRVWETSLQDRWRSISGSTATKGAWERRSKTTSNVSCVTYHERTVKQHLTPNNLKLTS